MNQKLVEIEIIARKLRHSLILKYESVEGLGSLAAGVLIAQFTLNDTVDQVCIELGQFQNSKHTWVRLLIDDVSWIVDPTATQFGEERPLLLKEIDAKKDYEAETYLVFNTKSLKELQAVMDALASL